MRLRSPVWTWGLLVAAAGAVGAQQADLDVGSVAGTAGASVALPIDLATDQGIAALQLDLTYSPSLLTPTGASIGGAAVDHVIDSAVVAGKYRVVVYSPTNAALVSGQLASIQFTISGAASPQSLPIGISAVVLSNDEGVGITPTLLDPGTITVQAGATPTDLAITKSGYMNFAEQVIFTVTATNNGPNAANGATVADTLPAEIATASWTCTPSGGATCPGGPLSGNLNALVNLPASGQVVFQATCTLAVAPGGNTTNTATVSVPAGMSDTNPANNTAQVTVPLTPLVIFADGFESGNTGQWSATTGGFVGLRIELDLGAKAALGAVVRTSGTTSADPFRLELRQGDKGRELRAVIAAGDGRWESRWIAAPADAQLRLHWWSERPPGASNGGLRLWIDGKLAVDATGITNDGIEVLGLEHALGGTVERAVLEAGSAEAGLRVEEVTR